MRQWVSFWLLIIPLFLGAMILISSTKTLRIGLFKRTAKTKMLWFTSMRFRSSFLRRNIENLLYQRWRDCLRLYKAFTSLHIMFLIASIFVPFGISKSVDWWGIRKKWFWHLFDQCLDQKRRQGQIIFWKSWILLPTCRFDWN